MEVDSGRRQRFFQSTFLKEDLDVIPEDVREQETLMSERNHKWLPESRESISSHKPSQ